MADGSLPLGDVNERLLDELARMSFEVMARLTRLAAEEELSLTQLRMLAILRDRQPRMAELAMALGVDRSSVSGLIARAEQRDLVIRSSAAGDGRGVSVGLTDAGRVFTGRLSRRVSEELEPLVASLDGTERELLAAALGRVTGR